MLVCHLVWILLEQTLATEDILYVEGTQEQSLTIPCEINQGKANATAFYFYRTSDLPGKKDVEVSLTEDENVTSKIIGPIKISGQLSSYSINITLLNPHKSDTGLYICEFISATTLSDSKAVLLLVEFNYKGGHCPCFSRTLIYAFAAATAILFVVSLSTVHYHKMKAHADHQTAVPIYEHMNRDRGSSAHFLDNSAAENPEFTEEEKTLYAIPRKQKSKPDEGSSSIILD